MLDELDELDRDGSCWIRRAFVPRELASFSAQLSKAQESFTRPQKAGAGVRFTPASIQLLTHTIFNCAPLNCAVRNILGSRPLLVRGILFDKSPDARWRVDWHRDTMIPVQAHLPSDTLTAPSVKDEIPHVRASVPILGRMLSIRIHLDAMTADNGPLFVIPGSHAITEFGSGPLPESEKRRAIMCRAEPGDVLLMRPLILHSSPKPNGPLPRRILHLEFSPDNQLPDGFSFFEPETISIQSSDTP